MKHIKALRFLQRKTLGPYEHRELEVHVVVEDGEDSSLVTRQTIDFVDAALRGSLVGDSSFSDTTRNEKTGATTAQTGRATVKETIVSNGNSNTSQCKEADKSKTEQGAGSTSEVKAPKEDKKETPKDEKEKKVAAGKKTKNELYDRENPTHKDLFGSYLDTAHPGWRNGDLLKKAGAVSRALTGKEDFLDGAGEMLPAFVEKFEAELKILIGKE